MALGQLSRPQFLPERCLDLCLCPWHGDPIAPWVVRNPDQGDLSKFPLHDCATARLAVIEAAGNVIALEVGRTADRANASRRPSWAKSDPTVESENAALVDEGFVFWVINLSATKPPIYPQPECMGSGEAVAISATVHQEGINKQLKRLSCT